MNNINVIENKISSIKRYLSLLKKYKKYPIDKIVEEPFLKGSLERYLYLAMQSTIDLAEAFIAYKNFRKPTAYREAFEILKEEKVLPVKLTTELTQMVGLRNAIAHDYENLDFHRIEDVLKNKLVHIEQFIKKITEKA